MGNKLPVGITQEQVDDWKKKYKSVVLQSIAGQKFILRPAFRGDLKKSGNDYLKGCVLHPSEFNPSDKNMPPGLLDGLTSVLDRISGHPPGGMGTVVVNGEFFEDLETENPEEDFYESIRKSSGESAEEAIKSGLESYSSVILCICPSPNQDLMRTWVFRIPTTEEMQTQEEESILGYVTSKCMLYVSHIETPEEMLAGHYECLEQAIEQVCGFTPTSDPVFL